MAQMVQKNGIQSLINYRIIMKMANKKKKKTVNLVHKL